MKITLLGGDTSFYPWVSTVSYFLGSGRYLNNQREMTANVAEPINVPRAILKFSVRALLRAAYRNQIWMLTSRINSRMMPVINVLVLLGWASFWEYLKLLFIPVRNYVFELGRRLFHFLPRPQVEEAALVEALVSLPQSLGQNNPYGRDIRLG